MTRRISLKNVAIALLLSTLIFITGILFGYYTSERKYDDFENTISDLRLQTLSMGLQYDLISEDPCAISNATFLVAELSKLNSKLEYLENIYGVKDPEILRLKQYYSILQIQHWMLLRKSNEDCNRKYNHILYFYSNEDCNECRTQGVVLTAFRKKYQDDVKVYAFDKDLEDPAVKTLTDLYNVDVVPTIVFNDQIFEKLISLETLELLRMNNSINSS